MRVIVTDKKKYKSITAVDLREANAGGDSIMGKVSVLFRNGKKETFSEGVSVFSFQKDYGFIISMK